MPKPGTAKRQRFSRASELGGLALAALAICEIVPACGSGTDNIQYERGDAGRVLLTGDGGGPITPSGAGGHRRGAGGSENGDAGPDASATGDGGSPGGSGSGNGGSSSRDGGSINGGGGSSGAQSGGHRCGDHHQDSDEQCDDGNLVDFDGCSSGCTIEQPACATCMVDAYPHDTTGCTQVSGCSGYPFCGDYPDAASQAQCSRVLACAIKSECVYKKSALDPVKVRGTVYCYCGETDSGACKLGSPQGPCKDEIEAGFLDDTGKPFDSGAIYGLISVPQHPAGGALFLAQTEWQSCGTDQNNECTPADQLGAGGSGTGGTGAGGAGTGGASVGGAGGSGTGGAVADEAHCDLINKIPPPGTSCTDCEATACPNDATGCDTPQGCSAHPDCTDYASDADRQTCATVLGCLRQTDCALMGTNYCFCGTFDDATCKNVGSTDGPCFNTLKTAAPTSTNTDILAALLDVHSPIGGAMSKVQCDVAHCAPALPLQPFVYGPCLPYCRYAN